MTDDAAAPPHALSQDPEPAPRRRARRLALAALVVVLACLLGYAKGALDHRSEAHQVLSRALLDIHDADPDLAAVDHAFRLGATTEGGAAAKAAYDPLVRAKKRLEDAVKLVSEAEPEARGADRDFARALKQSAEGRLAMLAAASDALPLQARASDALHDAEAAWASVQRAAVLSDQAAQAFNTHSRAGVTSSTALTEQAESELTSAEVALGRAARAMPEAKLAPLLTLVADRRGAATGSKRVDAVWLSGGVAEANVLLARLVGDQTQAAAHRPALPKTAGDPIRAAYRKLIAEAESRYAKARELADKGDTRLQRLLDQPSE